MDIKNISKYFVLEHEAIETSGFGNGVIIKFKTFYLKIYNDINGSRYDIEGYKYNNSVPDKRWKIPYRKFKRFAKSIKSEDFLDISCDHIGYEK